ncbi:hypothetical protein AB0H71_29055 [Nocardia sp. NPDC050697]|uniref:hypothetical protein n=1 Tax=Nocardia sp. NPDC050697 TaxID=3155158 RepID=UPI0033FAFE81
MITRKAWIRYHRNVQLELDDFYVSYNSGEIAPFIPAFAADNGGAETALCKDGKYFILNGDHREQYENLVDEGFGACYAYFMRHQDERSSWSSDPEGAAELLLSA